MSEVNGAYSIPKVYKPSELQLNDEKSPEGFGDFAGMLKSALAEVNSLQHQRTTAEQGLVTGADISLHQVMVVTEQARLSLDFVMAVRNKIMDAYSEIMRMQV